MNKDVSMGDIAAGKSDDNLIASGIGSCVVVTLYDPKGRIGALAHTMLPARRLSVEARTTNDERRKTNPGLPDTRYADTAIDEMLNRIAILGAKKENLQAKLIGGANMFSAFTSDIGRENVSSARNKLKKEGIPLVGECVGGSQGRSVDFSLSSGVITVKTKF